MHTLLIQVSKVDYSVAHWVTAHVFHACSRARGPHTVTEEVRVRLSALHCNKLKTD